MKEAPLLPRLQIAFGESSPKKYCYQSTVCGMLLAVTELDSFEKHIQLFGK
jgi:hypothetical protein